MCFRDREIEKKRDRERRNRKQRTGVSEKENLKGDEGGSR